MISGKAEVLSMKIEPNGDMRVTLADREDMNLFISIMRKVTAPGTEFEIVSDNEVLCKLPRG